MIHDKKQSTELLHIGLLIVSDAATITPPHHAAGSFPYHYTPGVLRPLYSSASTQSKTGGFVGVKFCCPHDPADGSWCIWIREKTVEFS